MAELQTIKDRLKYFVESQGISVRKFERDCGLSNGFIKNIRQSIQPDKLEMIAERFPTLNKAWLMTGEGTMLRSSETPEKPVGSLDQVLEQYQQVLAEMGELRKKNADLTAVVGKVREIQQQLEAERAALLEQNQKLTDIIDRLTAKEG